MESGEGAGTSRGRPRIVLGQTPIFHVQEFLASGAAPWRERCCAVVRRRGGGRENFTTPRSQKIMRVRLFRVFFDVDYVIFHVKKTRESATRIIL
jgi:hypothetical protein